MLWNRGDFIPYTLAGGNGKHSVTFVGKEPGFDLVSAPFKENNEFLIEPIDQSIHSLAHLRVKVLSEHDASVKVLRVFKNRDKYPAHDPFAPSQYDFEYVFATSMAGQPLAWFEATGLPEEALEIEKTIKKYRDHQEEFHSGYIFPIGEEPSGRSWTGFHSVNPNKKEGYMLIYRELNEREEAKFTLSWLQEGTYTFTYILGEGNGFAAKVGPSHEVEFSLPNPNSYQLLKYRMVQP